MGKKITIHENRGICAHAGHYTDNLEAVFKMNEEPWIDPDAATVEQIVDDRTSCMVRCWRGPCFRGLADSSTFQWCEELENPLLEVVVKRVVSHSQELPCRHDDDTAFATG